LEIERAKESIFISPTIYGALLKNIPKNDISLNKNQDRRKKCCKNRNLSEVLELVYFE
jgi:hypothetical protein